MSGYQPNSLNNTPSAVSAGTSLGAATLGVKMLPIGGKQTFIVGMGAQSFSGQPSVEFGLNPLQPKTAVAYDPAAVVAALKDIADAGCNVVSIPIFTKLDGLMLDSNGEVTGLDEAFKKNLSDFLTRAQTAKMQVYLSLGEPWNGLTGVKDPITDTAARTAFFKKALMPVVQNLKGRACVMGLDVVNDIESDIAGKDGNGTKTGTTWDQARDYIKAAAQFVKSVNPQRLVSCGAGLHGWHNVEDGKYSKLGLDFYDVRVYDDKGNLPTAKQLKLDRPVLIGACGQESKKSDDNVQALAAYDFLTNAQKNGYAGVVLTDYAKDADNPLSLLTKDGKHRPVFAQLQKFASTLAMNATAPAGSAAPTSAFTGPGLGK